MVSGSPAFDNRKWLRRGWAAYERFARDSQDGSAGSPLSLKNRSPRLDTFLNRFPTSFFRKATIARLSSGRQMQRPRHLFVQVRIGVAAAIVKTQPPSSSVAMLPSCNCRGAVAADPRASVGRLEGAPW